MEVLFLFNQLLGKYLRIKYNCSANVPQSIMPTFKIEVGKVKLDKTYPLYIILIHNRLKKHLPTGRLVVKKQLNVKGALKDEAVIEVLRTTVKKYRERLLRLPDLNNLSVEFLKEFLLRPDEDEKKEIDFIKFGQAFVKTQSGSTGENTTTVLNALIDFLGRDHISIHSVNLNLLNSFEDYLKTERVAKRNNGTGGITEYKLKPVSNTAIKDYIGKLRQIFKAAQDEYNDEDTGKMAIVHYPFRKFKMPKAKTAKKRNLKPTSVKIIRDAKNFSRRADLARDVFMLSFYLVGSNSIDLYNAKSIKGNRLSYYRAKTESRKEEQSFISIKIEPEVLPYLEKYKDLTGKRVFNFYHEYASSANFNKAVNLGLKTVCENESVDPINLGYARGGWATIARNECDIPKEDIHFALNHSDPDMKVTDLYIEEDFSIIDEANRKVLNTLKNKKG